MCLGSHEYGRKGSAVGNEVRTIHGACVALGSWLEHTATSWNHVWFTYHCPIDSLNCCGEVDSHQQDSCASTMGVQATRQRQRRTSHGLS